jgi:hypothetical protein
VFPLGGIVLKNIPFAKSFFVPSLVLVWSSLSLDKKPITKHTFAFSVKRPNVKGESRMTFLPNRRTNFIYKILSVFVTLNFLVGTIFPAGVSAQMIAQPPSLNIAIQPGVAFTPATIKGITLYPDNPLKFDFIIDQGETHLQGEAFKKEAAKLIKYFMASLTVPEDQTWVNLSPYEKDRIIPNEFGSTEMGQDMLTQDYLLKQLTASMMHPESELGKTFWNRVYQKTQEKFGTKDIPLNTFNKIWIMPDKAFVYEHTKGAFIVDSHLKVMLEEDYLALEHNKKDPNNAIGADSQKIDKLDTVSTQIIREIIIPEIEKEVNTGKTFANLRQIYNSMILATWYKETLKQTILGQAYADKNKVNGIVSPNEDVKEKVYNQYLETFKKGAYDLVKDDYDPQTQSIVSHKYFSGGITGKQTKEAIAKGRADQNMFASRPDEEKKVLAAAQSITDGMTVTMEVRGGGSERVSPQLEIDAAMLSEFVRYRRLLANEMREVKALLEKGERGNWDYNVYYEIRLRKVLATTNKFIRVLRRGQVSIEDVNAFINERSPSVRWITTTPRNAELEQMSETLEQTLLKYKFDYKDVAMLNDKVILKAAKERITKLNDSIVTLPRIQALTRWLNGRTGGWNMDKDLAKRIEHALNGLNRYGANVDIPSNFSEEGQYLKKLKVRRGQILLYWETKKEYSPLTSADSPGPHAARMVPAIGKLTLTSTGFMDLISELAEKDIQAVRDIIKEVPVDLSDEAMLIDDQKLALYRDVLQTLQTSVFHPDANITIKEIPVNLSAGEKTQLIKQYRPIAEELSETMVVDMLPGHPKAYEVVVTDNRIGLKFSPAIVESFKREGDSLEDFTRTALMMMQHALETVLTEEAELRQGSQEIELGSDSVRRVNPKAIEKKTERAMLSRRSFVIGAAATLVGAAGGIGYLSTLKNVSTSDTVHIRSTLAEVWKALVDPSTIMKWEPELKEFLSKEAYPVVGKSYDWKYQVMGFDLILTETPVTLIPDQEYAENNQLAYKGSPIMTWTTRYKLHQKDNGEIEVTVENNMSPATLKEMGVLAVEIYRYLVFTNAAKETSGKLKEFLERDQAIVANSRENIAGTSHDLRKGGIDFNPKALDLNIKRDGTGVPLPVSQQPIEEFMKIDTFAPIIINVAPIQNLPLILGLNGENTVEQLSHL